MLSCNSNYYKNVSRAVRYLRFFTGLATERTITELSSCSPSDRQKKSDSDTRHLNMPVICTDNVSHRILLENRKKKEQENHTGTKIEQIMLLTNIYT